MSFFNPLATIALPVRSDGGQCIIDANGDIVARTNSPGNAFTATAIEMLMNAGAEPVQRRVDAYYATEAAKWRMLTGTPEPAPVPGAWHRGQLVAALTRAKAARQQYAQTEDARDCEAATDALFALDLDALLSALGDTPRGEG